jgi:EmrB/QacA subfamily drug resistance transporter
VTASVGGPVAGVAGGPVAGGRRRVALLVSVVGAAMVALDGTVLIVAQPSIGRDLGATVGQVQWTGTAYLVAVAALLVISGRLGDRYGHRRLLLVGVLGFAAASAGIALAPDIGWVIGLRAVQGVFGALLQPATLALLRLAYPPDRLSGPVAIRTSAIGLASATGPVLGGALVAAFGWRSVFVLTVPVALVCAVAVLAVRVPVPPRTGAGRLDLTGAALLAATLAAGVHTLSGVPADGWTGPPTLLGYGLTAALAVALVWYERRTAQPTVPPAVARSVPVLAAMAMLLVTAGGLFGALFAASFLLQDVLRLDALASGLRVLPLTVMMVLGAPVTSIAIRRFGPRRTAVTGALLVTTGVAALSWLGPGTGALPLGAVFTLLGAGFAAVMVTCTGTVVGDAPPGYAGVVGGLKQTAMNIGPTLGIAIAASTSTAAATFPLLAALVAVALIPAALLPRAGRPAAAAPEDDLRRRARLS